MHLDTWDTLFNILFLFFWFKIWVGVDRVTFFNPHLSHVSRFSDSIIDFLKPVFFGASSKFIAIFSLCFLFVFRGVLFLSLAGRYDTEWVLSIEFVGRQVASHHVVTYVAFSVLSFVIFLLKLWALSLVYAMTGRNVVQGHTTNALSYLARPFSGIAMELRPIFFFICATLTFACLDYAGTPVTVSGLTMPVEIGWDTDMFVLLLVKLVILSFVVIASVFPIIIKLLVMLIIGSLISMLARARTVMFFCREWIDMLLGPLHRYPVRIGAFDFTPLVFVIITVYIYGIMMHLLMKGFFGLG